MKFNKFFFFFLFIASYESVATVDYLNVNHLTEELFWGDEDNSTGFIGWKQIPDGIYEESESKYLNMGYTYTKFPFKIEAFLFGILTSLFLSYFVIRRKRKSNIMK